MQAARVVNAWRANGKTLLPHRKHGSPHSRVCICLCWHDGPALTAVVYCKNDMSQGSVCDGFLEAGRREEEMKKRILLVDDEVAVLLTLKAVLEINGFDVDTAASGREGKLKLRSHEYDMVISDMRMESDQAGAAVIAAARSAEYKPAVALLTAYPLADEDWQEMGADRMLVKPMHTRLLLEQIDRLMNTHIAKRSKLATASSAKKSTKKTVVKKTVAKKVAVVKKAVAKKSPARKAVKTGAKVSVKKAAKKGAKR